MKWNDLQKWIHPGRRGLHPAEWEGEVAFIRLDFPPEHRDLAQHFAAVLGCIVGKEIRRLRPEHRIVEIVQWGESDSLDAVEAVMVLEEQFGFEMDATTTFRQLVERSVRPYALPQTR